MKRIYAYMIIAVLAAFSAGCVKEEGQNEVIRGSEGTPVVVDFTSSLESDYLTKTLIGDEEGVRSVTWSEGDRISIISGDGSSVSADIGVDGSIEDVSLMQSNIYYAVYPEDTEASYGLEGISFTVPALQNGRFEDANLMVATASDNERHFRFKNMVSMLQIDVDSEKYDKVIIRSNDGAPLVGRQTVRMDQDGEIVSIASDDEDKTAEIILEIDGNGPYYVAMLADASLPAGLGFRFFKDGEPVSGALSITPMEAERSSIRELSPVDNIVKDWYITSEGTGNGLSESTPGGIRLLHSLLSVNIAEGVVNEGYTNAWRIDGATIHLAEGTYALADFEIGFKDAVEFSVEAPSGGNTVFTTNDGSIIKFDAKECKATFSNICFTGGKAADNGGAFLVTSGCSGSMLEFNGCAFMDNVAGDKSKTTETNTMLGGALYVGNGEVHINECIFDGNHANLGAHISMMSANPKVFVNRSVFKNGTAYHQKGDWMGAAVNSQNTNAMLCINNCIFYNNASPNTTSNDGLPCIRTNGVRTLVLNSSFAHKGLRTINPVNGGTGAHIINNISKNLGSRDIDIANAGTRKYNLTVTSPSADDTGLISNDNLSISWDEDSNTFTWTLSNVVISKYAGVSEISSLVSTDFADFGSWLDHVESDPFGIDFYGNKRNPDKMNPGAWDPCLN